MLMDIGASAPVELEHLGMLSRFGDVIHLYDSQTGRYYERRLGRIPPSEIVRVAGGAEAFSCVVFFDTGAKIWVRKSLIRGVFDMPEPLVEENGRGAFLQMVWDRPFPQPWPRGRRMVPDSSVDFPGVSAADVEAMLSNSRYCSLELPDRRQWMHRSPPATAVAIRRAAERRESLRPIARSIAGAARRTWKATPSSTGASRLGGSCESAAVALTRTQEGLALVLNVELCELEGGAGVGLPGSGRLLFFYDVQKFPWGSAPSESEGWAVLHSTECVRRADTTERSAFPEVPVRFLPELSLPVPGNRDAACLLELGSTTEEDDYLQLWVDLFGEPGTGVSPGTWVGGYPYQLQGDMQEQCAEMADAAWDLKSKPSEWRLLLQLGSEPAADMNWGEEGFLYYWIRESDLAAHDFSHVWCILQTM